jgi:hypothetical protein
MIKFKSKFLDFKKIIKGIRVVSTPPFIKTQQTSPKEFSSKLGRKFAFDIRDNSFQIEKHLQHLLTPSKTITSKYWSNTEWCGDQKDTPMCVGYGWAHWISGGPVTHSGIQPIINPITIYNGAQQNDEWPGPPPSYDGTSVRGGAKWLKAQNKISSYLWTNNLTTLTNTVLNIGPVVVGTNWYYNMFFPDRNGLIKATGSLVGGHCYVLDGVDTIKKQFRLKNSWGLSWGVSGCAYISFTDMQKLITQQGEVCLAVEMNF